MTTEMLTDLLRGRILRGLRAGTLAPGDRLPSARRVGAELSADHRMVLAAYHVLAAEGVVELRQRAGIFVARRSDRPIATPGEGWLIDTLLDGLVRDVPIVDLHQWMRRAVATRSLRATVIEGTADQIAGICRELRVDYGFDATGIEVGELAELSPAMIEELGGADLLVSTAEFRNEARGLGQRFGIPVVIAEVGPDLLGGDWRQLLREPLYLVLGDARSVDVVRARFSSIPAAAENLHIVVVGRDDLGLIPKDAAVYVSRGAASALGDTKVQGRVLPTARGFSIKTARELVTAIVHANLAALSDVADGPTKRVVAG
ncbi:MAG: GntR family transcriptional regulator [Gemmatimonadaceae bacterium]